jgi:hypothetical protein
MTKIHDTIAAPASAALLRVGAIGQSRLCPANHNTAEASWRDQRIKDVSSNGKLGGLT